MNQTFSLKRLLSFVFACSAYFAALPAMLQYLRDPTFYPSALATVTLGASWLMLGLVYASWRLKSGLLIHCFGPLAVGGLLMFDGSPIQHSYLHALMVGCLVSTLIGFPIATLVILTKAFDRTRREGG